MKETTTLVQDGERHPNEMSLLMKFRRRRRKSLGGSSLSEGDETLSEECITFKLLACQRLSLTNTFSHCAKPDRISHAEIISDMVDLSLSFFSSWENEEKIKDKKMVNSKEREKNFDRHDTESPQALFNGVMNERKRKKIRHNRIYNHSSIPLWREERSAQHKEEEEKLFSPKKSPSTGHARKRRID